MSYFQFVDFKKNLKTELSAASKVYVVAVLLTNAHTWLCGSQTGSFLNLDTALLEQYFERCNTKKTIFLEVSFLFIATQFYLRLHSVHPPLLSVQGEDGGWELGAAEPPTKFSKRGCLTGP